MPHLLVTIGWNPPAPPPPPPVVTPLLFSVMRDVFCTFLAGTVHMIWTKGAHQSAKF